jgi:serine/threonine protein kinase
MQPAQAPQQPTRTVCPGSCSPASPFLAPLAPSPGLSASPAIPAVCPLFFHCTALHHLNIIDDLPLTPSGGPPPLQTGTRVYAAPEVLQVFDNVNPQEPKRRYIAAKADVWSCGVVLFQMLFPFDFNQQLEEPPEGVAPWPTWAIPTPIASGRSVGCTQLLHAMLHPDPKCRASVSEVLGHPWFQVGSTADTSTLWHHG